MTATYQDYYQQVAPILDGIRLDGDEEIALSTDAIHAALVPDQGTVLDVGCGSGRYARDLRRTGHQIAGLDISLSQLQQAAPHLPTVCGSALELPYRSNTFSACLLIMAIHQLAENQRARALLEIHRVLRANGLLFIKTRSHEQLHRRPSVLVFPSYLPMNLNRYPAIPELLGTLRVVGFSRPRVIFTRTERSLSRSDYLRGLRARHNSSLALLPPEEFEAGYRRLEWSLSDVTAVTVPLEHTLVLVQKPEAPAVR